MANKEDSRLNNDLKNNYEILKTIGFSKYGEIFLISYKQNIDSDNTKLYIMEKIEINSENKRKTLERIIQIFKKIESNYVMKMFDLFFEEENEKNYGFIVMEYCSKGNLYKIMYDTNYLNERTIWRIFIQLTKALKTLQENNIFLKYFSPNNIFIDKANNIKLGLFDILFDLDEDYNLINDIEDISSYIAPEILNYRTYSKDKCVTWTLGCILYELLFKKRAFEYEEESRYILKNKFEIPDSCERDFEAIIHKLLCKEVNRLTINELIFDGIFKKKVIEINMFDEFLKNKIQCKYIFI